MGPGKDTLGTPVPTQWGGWGGPTTVRPAPSHTECVTDTQQIHGEHGSEAMSIQGKRAGDEH